MPLPLIAAIGIGLAAAGLTGKAISTATANKRNNDLAEDLSDNLEAQADAVAQQNQQKIDELEAIRAGKVPIPIERVTPEDILLPSTAFDVYDDAASDKALVDHMAAADRALSQRVAAASGNSRIAAVNAAKAAEDYKSGIKQTANDLAKEKREAAKVLTGQITEVNKFNSAQQVQADRDYASFKNQYLKEAEKELSDEADTLAQQERELEYQALEIPGMAGVQNAANTGQMFGDIASTGVGVAGLAEQGAKLPSNSDNYAMFSQRMSQLLAGDNSLANAIANLSISEETMKELEENRKERLEKREGRKKDRRDIRMFEEAEEAARKREEIRSKVGETGALEAEQLEGLAGLESQLLGDIEMMNDGKLRQDGGTMSSDPNQGIDDLLSNTSSFSKKNGGQVDFTNGEFNHGELDKPETGNDQVLLDQEELKKVMDSQSANSFDELMELVPPDVVTTGEEMVLSKQQTMMLENMTKATEMGLDDDDMAMNMARKGRKVKSKKGRKKSKKQIDKANAELAAYLRSLLAKPQFRGDA